MRPIDPQTMTPEEYEAMKRARRAATRVSRRYGREVRRQARQSSLRIARGRAAGVKIAA